MRLRTRAAGWLPLLGLLAGCSGAPALPDLEEGGREFSPSLLKAHLEALSGLSPRWPDSREDRRARRYLARAFDAVGAEVVAGDPDAAQPLVAEVAGRSSDVVLLVAAYSTLGSSEWIDDSGAALLIELARLYAVDEAPAYTVRFALADVRPDARQGDSGGWKAIRRRSQARERIVLAGRSLAESVSASSSPGSVRAVIAFEPQAIARPRMARDLRSHPVFRELFWDTALRLGHANAFPKDSGWSSAPGLHTAFGALADDRVLSLIDERWTRAELGSPVAAAAPQAVTDLEPIGAVTRAALARLMGRFEKIDGFAP